MNNLNKHTTNRIAPLDTWRAIAALGVVWIHCWTHFNNPSLKIGPIDFYRFIAIVGNGVDFFFVISGFCLYIVWRSKDINFNNYISFIKKRWLRIAPAFYAAAAIVALYLFLFEKKNVLVPLLANIIFVQNYSDDFSISPPFWSLAVEFHFYALIPFFIYFSRKQFWLTIITTYILSNFLLFKFHTLNYNYVIQTKGIHFLMGIVLAWLFYEKQSLVSKYFNSIIHFFIAVLVLFIGRYLLSEPFVGESSINAPFFKVLGMNLLIIGFTAAVWVTMVNNILNNIFSSTVGKWLGKLSYSIYLWHAFIMLILSKIWPDINNAALMPFQPLFFFVGVLFLLIPVAALSYNLFEKFYFKKTKSS